MFSRTLSRPLWLRMLSTTVAACCCLTTVVTAAPALTTIQDVLYKADGSRFNGVLQIAWNTFQSADAANVPTQSVTTQVTNGYLHVLLAPTTNAASPAVYNVVYNSDGKVQFTETWVVPPSTSPLRVADVRSSSTVGGAAALAQIQITDVAGLRTELNIRPTMGAGYSPSRAAVIDSTGGVSAAAGNLSDCLHVDGSSGPCGGGGGASAGFVDAEIPTGPVDGANVTFALSSTPNPASSVAVFRNGLALQKNIDYTVSAATITFQAGSVPQPGDVLQASYRLAPAAASSSTSLASTPAASTTPPCALYSVSNNGTNWMVSVNGGAAIAGPAIGASPSQDVPLFTLPPRSIVTGVREKSTAPWSGSSFASLSLSVGDSAGGAAFYTPPSYDLTAAVTDTNFRATQLFKSATDAGSTVNAHIMADTALNGSTIAGAVDVDVCWVTLP